MSQVKFRAVTESGPVEIMAGWDRPLQEFFLTVFDLVPEAEEETLWSTVNLPSSIDTKTTLRIRTKLVELGIEAPEGFWERVERREANVTHTFGANGWESWAF